MFAKVAKGKAKLLDEKSELFGSMAARRNYTKDVSEVHEAMLASETLRVSDDVNVASRSVMYSAYLGSMLTRPAD
jgi:hypothetical protein